MYFYANNYFEFYDTPEASITNLNNIQEVSTS
jgi:hypothetical protein